MCLQEGAATTSTKQSKIQTAGTSKASGAPPASKASQIQKGSPSKGKKKLKYKVRFTFKKTSFKNFNHNASLRHH